MEGKYQALKVLARPTGTKIWKLYACEHGRENDLKKSLEEQGMEVRIQRL